jgi:hypothetical protein
MSLIGSGAASAKGNAGLAFGTYDVGLRKFLQYPSEDTLVQAANAEGLFYLYGPLNMGVDGYAKDRRGGDRDYSDLLGAAFLEYSPDESLSMRLHVAGHRFIYWDNFAYSFAAPEVGVSGRYRFSRRHSAFFNADLGLRSYNVVAEPDEVAPRKDTAVNVVIGYAYRGPFTLTVSYNYFEQDSNSFGESLQRHRAVATAAVRLPWKLFLLAEGAIQYTRYPDGIFLSADVLLSQDEERNTNALSVKLVRPLDAHVDAEAHYGLYHNRLPPSGCPADVPSCVPQPDGLTYWRQVAWVGLTWRL